MVNIVTDNIENHLSEHDVILVGTNQNCSLSQGFQRYVMLHYPEVQEANMSTRYGDMSKLGSILTVDNTKPLFCLCYICTFNTRPDLKKDTLDYDALSECLLKVREKYGDASIGTTILGASRFDGNGDKGRIIHIFKDVFDGSTNNATLYDYEQLSRAERMKSVRDAEMAVRDNNINEYYRMVSRRKKEAEEVYKKNGHVRY